MKNNVTDIRQSPQFAAFMENLGWDVINISGVTAYRKHFAFLGDFIKIPRPKVPLPISELNGIRNNNRIYRIKLSPFLKVNEKSDLQSQLKKNRFRTEYFPFNPTTTIHIDLTRQESELFNSFTSAKRRAVRKAIKNNIYIQKTDNLNHFISVRKAQYFPLGFLVTKEMQELWNCFYPRHADLLLAYQKGRNDPLAGILLLRYDSIAYYWFASALRKGKSLFAPTLLVWEAIKLAKKKNCRIFDFEGIYDERFPKASESWRGFTKFKEGFGGSRVVYIPNFTS